MEGKVHTISGKLIRSVASVNDGTDNQLIFNNYARQYDRKNPILQEYPNPYISVGFEVGSVENGEFIVDRSESEPNDFSISEENYPVEFPNLPGWAGELRKTLIEDANELIDVLWPRFETLLEKQAL